MEPEGVIESTWHEVYDNFDDMNLREELLRGIYGYGFEKPSAIQQRAIIPCVRGRDVIAQAQSGKFFILLCNNINQKFCLRYWKNRNILHCHFATSRYLHP